MSLGAEPGQGRSPAPSMVIAAAQATSALVLVMPCVIERGHAEQEAPDEEPGLPQIEVIVEASPVHVPGEMSTPVTLQPAVTSWSAVGSPVPQPTPAPAQRVVGGSATG